MFYQSSRTCFWLASFYLCFITLNGQYTKEQECAPPPNEICEYWWYVRTRLVMQYQGQRLTWNENEQRFYNHSGLPTDIPVDQVITLDGYPKMAMTINGTVPGPPLIVYEGQRIIIHLHNHLLSDSVTIHWHGLHQRGTPWMDGVGYVSQCPIGAGQVYTYNFTTDIKGTYWYHSHMGSQRTDGLYGPLIIKERPNDGTNETYEERIMTVGDWTHDRSEEVWAKMQAGGFYSGSSSPDGAYIDMVPWDSAIINGKGRYYNKATGKWSEVPLEKFNVEKDKTYRFRVINVGTMYQLRISVDDHNISVIATDGFDVDPWEVESFIINPGERYDFLLNTSQPVDNYWIRANSIQVGYPHHRIEAILHYKGAHGSKQPTSKQRNCTLTGCKVVNCPFKYYPSDENTECIILSNLTNANPNDLPPEFEVGSSEEHFLNFGFPDFNKTSPGAVNGKKFKFPAVDPLIQWSPSCNDRECGPTKTCYCQHELVVPFNKTIQIVMTNVGNGAGWSHPIHMHGHQFYVMKMGYPSQNQIYGNLTHMKSNTDIDCGASYPLCNDPQWKNASWRNGNVPGLNIKNAIRKDTIMIPTGGYAVVRIRSDNPGWWFMHCHIEMHLLSGMAMILNEAPEKLPTHPTDLPKCEGLVNITWYRNITKTTPKPTIAVEELIEECTCDKWEHATIIVAVIAGLLLIALIVAIVCMCKRKAGDEKDENYEMN